MCCPFFGGGSFVVESLLSVTLIVGFCRCSKFCCALFRVHSSFATILKGKKETWLLCFVCLVPPDFCVALSRDAMGLSAVFDCGIS